MKKSAPKKVGRPKSDHIVPTVSVNLRLTEPLLKILDRVAEVEGRSRTKQVEVIVKGFLDNYKDVKK